MTGQAVYCALGPKEIMLFREIYERAMAVKAKYPESHAASKAAKELIDAFEAVNQPDRNVRDVKWLREAKPYGSA